MQELLGRIEHAAARAQELLDRDTNACHSTPGPAQKRGHAALHDTVVHAVRTLCRTSAAQLQLDALQQASRALADIPHVHAEPSEAALERAKSHMDATATKAIAERDRLGAVQTAQLKQMTSAVLAADTRRAMDAMGATNAAIVECAEVLERSQAAKEALQLLEDGAFDDGGDGASAVFVARADSGDAVRGMCTRLVGDVLAELRSSFGDAMAPELDRLAAALQCDAPAASGGERGDVHVFPRDDVGCVTDAEDYGRKCRAEVRAAFPTGRRQSVA